ncbi:LCP family protein [Geodermatophilus sp. SYSU D00758]
MAPLPPIPGRDLPPSGATRLTPPGPRERRAARRASRSPARRHLVRAASALLVLVGVVVTYHLGLYFYVDQGMRRVAALAPAGPEVLAPQLQAGAQTYLVVGTGLPGAAGPAAVTALIAHVPADQDSAVLVSLPPAALVDTPACVQEDGDLREPATEAVATALLDGGPACLVRVVQQLSGLRVDHYLGVDLARVPGLVDALGGISLCLPTPSGADGVAASPLPAGTSELTGEQAAGYLRPGDAVDATGAAVAQRTQILLTATLDAAVSVDTLRDPVALTRFSVRASDALTVDQDTNLGDLRTLGDTLGDLGGDAVQRTELPVSRVDHVPAGEEQPVVVLDGGATRTLFETVIDSGRLPAELAAPPADAAAPAPAAEPAPGTAAPAPEPAPGAPTVPPGQVTVDVLNATATGGLAATAAEQLRTQGFVVGAVGNEPGAVAGTLVRYAPEAAEQARTVAAAVPGATLQEGVPAGSAVQLVLGPGYAGVVPVTVAPPPVAEPGPEAAAAAPETSPAASTEPVRC